MLLSRPETTMDTARNLLFGVLALQLKLIDAGQLADACAEWARPGRGALADVLVVHGRLTEDDRREVGRLLERKLQQCNGDVRQTLSLAADRGAREVLGGVTVADVQDVLNGLAPPSDSDLLETQTFPAAPPAGAGPPPTTAAGGRYTALRLHAEGGLGRVFVVWDNELRREVALKDIKPQQAQHPEARRRFLREAQVTGQLEHPGIVPVYELSRHGEGDNPYYTMRYLRGLTLREAVAQYHAWRRQGKVEPLERVRLLGAFVDICQAVAYAHSRGVLHRDLKPDNVMLGGFGEVAVLDWGLAKRVGQPEEPGEVPAPPGAAEPDATVRGQVLGTPAYMAPEQADARHDLIDVRTDVYLLGGVLFEILTGCPPHQGTDTNEVLRQIVAGPTPAAREVEPSAPTALSAVCSKAMAKRQEDRYQTAEELAEDVQRFLADEPVTAYCEPWWQRLARLGRRHRTGTVAAAGVLLAIAVTAAVAAGLLAALAQKEKRAREIAQRRQVEGARLAATFAARTVAGEIDRRWRILETEAGDAELRRLLRDINEDRLQLPADDLQRWIHERYARHDRIARATSWLLNDARGRHVARWPLKENIIGEGYAFRDYFHGEGRDYANGVKRTPITEVHRSIVFKSTAIFSRMVAFTVPVRDRRGEVIGVLGMTVELGRFSVLQVGLGKDQIAVLVDTRPDQIEGGEPRSGLVLHHPRLAEQRRAKEPPDIKRLPEQRVEWLRKLCAEKVRLQREREGRPRTNGNGRALRDNWVRDYHDPVYGGRWLAAFEPVLVPGRPDEAMNTGWVVIVQERLDTAGE